MAATTSAGRGARPNLKALYPYAYISPALAAIVVASLFPILYTIYIALENWDSTHNALIPNSGVHIVWLKNFQEVLASLNGGDFFGVLLWTIVFAAVTTAINFFLGLALGFLLNNPNMPERNVYRTLLILPWALPATIMILVWSNLMNTDFGPINGFLTSIHLGKVDWLGQNGGQVLPRLSVFIVNTWLGYPFMMTACLGALQSIPFDVGEAAQIDGATPWQRFWKITFPLLRTATLPLIIGTFAYNLNNFGVVYLLTQGGPATNISGVPGVTDILPTYTYRLAQVTNSYSLSAAFSLIIFIIIGTLSLINFKFTHAFEEVEK